MEQCVDRALHGGFAWGGKGRHHLRWVGRVMVTALLAFACLAPAVAAGGSLPATTGSTGSRDSTDTGTAARYGALPLVFEANAGQAAAGVAYVAHGKGYALALSPDALTLALTRGDGKASRDATPAARQTASLRFAFAGANPAPTLTSEDALPGVVNYLIGNDPAQWQTNVPTSARVRYTTLYPGIDLTVYGTNGGGGLEYDAIVAPGADPAAFALAISGADAVTLDADTGALILTTAAGEVRQHAPVAYQTVNGQRQRVTAGYEMRGDGTVGFAVGEYDARLPLVIDPQVVPVYSTFLGGSGDDQGNGIAVDTSGNAYVTGYTSSTNFPVTDGSTLGGGYDAFVTKFSASGTRVYSTYLGGIYDDEGRGIAVDTSGNVYVTGFTYSTNFPVTDGSTLGGIGKGDAFVTKFSASGVRVYSLYLGGSSIDAGYGIAVDASGNAYVTGTTYSTDFPVTDGSTSRGGGPNKAFVTKLNAGGVRVFSTYLGGSVSDFGYGIAVDTSGNAYVTGYTQSTDFPVNNGSTLGRVQDAFVTKFSASGVRVYSTYLGGSGSENNGGIDAGYGIAADASGNAYVTGYTASPDFPVTDGSTYSGGSDVFGGGDAFVTKLSTIPNPTPVPHTPAATVVAIPHAMPPPHVTAPTPLPLTPTPLPQPVRH